MTAYTTKTLAVAMANAHAGSPFADRDAAIMWAYSLGNGATLNMADKAYKLAGLKIGVKTSRKDEALDWLGAAYPTADTWTADAVTSAVAHMRSEFEVAESTARDYAKEHSEVLGVAHPSTPTLDSDEVIAWVVEHYDSYGADYEALKAALIEEFTARGRSRSNINEYTKGLRMHFAILAR